MQGKMPCHGGVEGALWKRSPCGLEKPGGIAGNESPARGVICLGSIAVPPVEGEPGQLLASISEALPASQA